MLLFVMHIPSQGAQDAMISRLHAAHEETGYQLGIEAAALAGR